MLNTKTWLKNYLAKELHRDPGICILTYPYSFAWEKISEFDIKQTWEYDKYPGTFAYVYIPFCVSECYFCGFYKQVGQPYSKIISYLDDLNTEIELAVPLLKERQCLAVSIGGGTPSLLKAVDLSTLLSNLKTKLNPAHDCEVTIEVYPDNSATAEKFMAMKESGANRVSFGFQSLNEEMKRSCNRRDTVEQNLNAYSYARKSGFDDVSIDLLCGLPNQTIEIWQDTIRRTIDLNPNQICFFPVSIRHPGIPFYEKVKQKLPPFEILKEMYFWARDALLDAGFNQLTRHNFAKPNYRGLYEYHQSYGTPGFGLGVNSISYLPSLIYKNTRDLDLYKQTLCKGELPVDTGFDLAKNHEDANAFVVRRLTYMNVNKEDFKHRFQQSFDEMYPEQIEALTTTGLAINNDSKFKLTKEGTYYTALVKRCFFSKQMHHLQTERLGRLKAPSREI